MPLAFPSKSHGVIAFGFFHIEIDMLLLENLFFFADGFCRAVVELSESGAAGIGGWRIGEREKIGNLHGAIAGADLSGFIGATYRRFPFPGEPERFKQNPEGSANRGWAEELAGRYGRREEILLGRDRGQIALGEYVFDPAAFSDLIAYVDRGGYPRWKDEVRPHYVRVMMEKLGRSSI
jgi:hypothetical protein